MSAEIVNLRQARKRRVRHEREVKAAENRYLFGRSRAERGLQAATRDLEDKTLSGRMRDNPGADGPNKDPD